MFSFQKPNKCFSHFRKKEHNNDVEHFCDASSRSNKFIISKWFYNLLLLGLNIRTNNLVMIFIKCIIISKYLLSDLVEIYDAYLCISNRLIWIHVLNTKWRYYFGNDKTLVTKVYTFIWGQLICSRKKQLQCRIQKHKRPNFLECCNKCSYISV